MLAALIGLALAGPAHARTYWFAPPGYGGTVTSTPAASSANIPCAYPASNPAGFANYVANTLSGTYETGALTNVEIRFYPGTYPTTYIPLTTTNMTNAVVTIAPYVGTNVTAGPVTLQLVSPSSENATTAAISRYYANVILWCRDGYYSSRFCMSDITLDCNWDNLGGWSAPSHAGFKADGLAWSAFTGSLKNVRVINAGASGMVPQNMMATGDVSGFPIWITCKDFTQGPYPGSGDPTAWVVDGCEISNYHAQYEGYAGTSFQITCEFPTSKATNGTPVGPFLDIEKGIPAYYKTLYPSFTNLTYLWQACDSPIWSTNRFATIRNCLVQGVGGGAFGMSASSGVTIRDCVVLSTSIGLNADYAHNRNYEMTNSVFLDVTAGCANIDNNLGPTTPGQPWETDNRVTITGNLIRISKRAMVMNYANFAWDTNSGYFRGTLDKLGSLYSFNWCMAFGVGNSTNVNFSYNRITTAPQGYFNELDPSNLTNATFYPCERRQYAIPAGAPLDMDPSLIHWQPPVNQDNAPYMLGVQVSGVACDFTNYTTLSSDSQKYNPYSAITNSTTAMARSPYCLPHRVERVLDGGGNLIGVREVALGSRVKISGNWSTQARWTQHPLPSDTANASTFGLAPDGGRSLQIAIHDSRSNLVTGLSGTFNLATGIATFTLPTLAANGYYHVTGWVPSPQNTTGSFDPSQDAWSETEWLLGNVVRFAPTNNVANCRAPGNGYLRLSRVGSGSITVKVTQVKLAPDGRDAVPGTDFTLGYTSGSSSSVTSLSYDSDGNYSIPFVSGETVKTLVVSPIKRGQQMLRAAAFALVDDTNNTYACAPSLDWQGRPPTRVTARDSGYDRLNSATAFPTRTDVARYSASVFLWDGPQWELVPLTNTPPAGATFVSSAAYGITYGPTGSAPPRIGGLVQYSGAANNYVAGYWTAPDLNGGSLSPVPLTASCSLTAMPNGLAVGSNYLVTYITTPSSSSSYLNLIATPVPYAVPGTNLLVYGTSPDAASSGIFVGTALAGSYYPAKWPISSGSVGLPSLLSGFTDPGFADGATELDSTLNRQFVVGATAPASNPTAYRAFCQEIVSGTTVTLPQSGPGLSDPSQALAVANRTNWVAVGWAYNPATLSLRNEACAWRMDDTQKTNFYLNVLPGDNASEARSVFYMATNRFLAVGYSVKNGSPAVERAFFYDSGWAPFSKTMSAGGMWDLNDPAFVQMPAVTAGQPAWQFNRALGINGTNYIDNMEYIVGLATAPNGTSGKTAAVLVPLKPYSP